MKKFEIDEFIAKGGLCTGLEGKPDEIFLVCASFEQRSIAIANSLSPKYRAERGIIYVNREFLNGSGSENTRKHLSHLENKLHEHCNNVEIAKGSWLNAREQLFSLKKALLPKKSEGKMESAITFDITTFNRESLLTATALLHKHYEKSKIRAIYTSPIDHGEWLSRGFRLVRNIMSFAGVQQESKPTLLVVLSGFEPERTIRIIEEHEPTKVLIGIGDPATDKKFLNRNKNEQKLILNRQDYEDFKFPADNIKNCWNVLESMLKTYHKSHNIVLAPMSTKLSSIAVFLTAKNHPNIQITYCLPGEYNTYDYSKGVKLVFIEDIPI